VVAFSLSQQQVTLLAGLYGATHGLIAQSGTTVQDEIRQQQAENEAEIFGWAIKDITKLPIAAIDHADRPARLAVRAAAEAVLAAIDRSGRTPPEEVSRYLGHSSTDVTRRYARQTPDALGRRAADALERSGLVGIR
jgi:integrase